VTLSPKARVFWPVLLIVLIGDYTTKQLAEAYLAPAHVPHHIAGDVVRLTLAHNGGAAMGLSLGRYSRLALSLAALFVLGVLGRMYFHTPGTARLRAAALALVIGGAIGNLASRLLSPYGVTDFVDLGLGSWRFYTFNVADVGITLGALLFLASVSWEIRAGRGAA
jgi:signal peptidase II